MDHSHNTIQQIEVEPCKSQFSIFGSLQLLIHKNMDSVTSIHQQIVLSKPKLSKKVTLNNDSHAERTAVLIRTFFLKKAAIGFSSAI